MPGWRGEAASPRATRHPAGIIGKSWKEPDSPQGVGAGRRVVCQIKVQAAAVLPLGETKGNDVIDPLSGRYVLVWIDNRILPFVCLSSMTVWASATLSSGSLPSTTAFILLYKFDYGSYSDLPAVISATNPSIRVLSPGCATDRASTAKSSALRSWTV